jgi:hypothetical protein
MRKLARVIFDEAHRPAWSTRPETAAQINAANPADSSYAIAADTLTSSGFEVSVSLEPGGQFETKPDVLVLLHGSEDEWESTTKSGSPKYSEAEIESIVEFVENGGGLIIFGETEQLKYGNSANAIANRFGLNLQNVTVQDSVNNLRNVASWVLADLAEQTEHDLICGVTQACFYRAGAIDVAASVADEARVIAKTSASASPANAALLVAKTHGRGRVIVAADSDLFGDDSILELDHLTLWRNIVGWAAAGATKASAATAAANRSANQLEADSNWLALVEAVEIIRPLQNKDGSIGSEAEPATEADRSAAAAAAASMGNAILGLAPKFAHQAEHLAQTVVDIKKWVASDFGVPDFLDSLMLFKPDEHRVDGLENLVVFPMYTQNGNLDRNFEAVVTRTVWPDWLAELEATKYNNPAFVPIEFVVFTKGYDTNSAVLFPETVATRELAKFSWGGIFCDREAARYRVVTSEAASLLRLSLPPDLELLIGDQRLAQETFVLWDLIHDRAHSHGDLPFDPFMIKQRMPFWMYALEELRCDLTTYRESLNLEKEGVHLARFVRLAVLFDRLFRFPITGDRVRNYDGLGGQLIFAWLHQNEVIHWTDNTLSVEWQLVDASMVELCEQVEELYSNGIDRSRMSHWLASYKFVSSWVEPHPASTWAKGADALPVTGELRELVDKVLPDEFPLNVFYEALRKKLSTVIAGTAGITA